MRKTIVTMLMITLLSLALLADTSGEAGFQMLRINPSAVYSAQAGTGAFFSVDGFAFVANPAINALHRTRVASMTQNYWLFDTVNNNFAYRYSTGKYGFGLGYNYLDYGKITRRDEVGLAIGEFRPMDLRVISNFAYRINPYHYAGVNVYGLYEKIDSASSVGLAFDLGYVFVTPIRDLYLGATLKHLGFTSKVHDENIKLPVCFDLSLGKQISWQQTVLSAEAKLTKYSDDDNIKAAVGSTLTLMDMLFIRLGYKLNYDLEDLSLGFGVLYGKFNFDYAYLPISEEFDDVHKLGLTYRF